MTFLACLCYWIVLSLPLVYVPHFLPNFMCINLYNKSNLGNNYYPWICVCVCVYRFYTVYLNYFEYLWIEMNTFGIEHSIFSRCTIQFKIDKIVVSKFNIIMAQQIVRCSIYVTCDSMLLSYNNLNMLLCCDSIWNGKGERLSFKACAFWRISTMAHSSEWKIGRNSNDNWILPRAYCSFQQNGMECIHLQQ